MRDPIISDASYSSVIFVSDHSCVSCFSILWNPILHQPLDCNSCNIFSGLCWKFYIYTYFTHIAASGVTSTIFNTNF